MEEFDRISEEQDWDHRVECRVLRHFVADLGVTDELAAFARDVQRFENTGLY